jgi:hypothetical protein
MLTFAPETAETLKERPEEVIAKLEQIREHCEFIRGYQVR